MPENNENKVSPEELEKFREFLEKHPKFLDSAERKEAIDHFKEKFGADKRSKLHCPICSRYMELGRLWTKEDQDNVYVCIKCHSEMRIEIARGGENGEST